MSSLTIDREGFLANAFLTMKAPCRVATTAAITLSGVQTIDGVQLEADDRVLVKDQTDTFNAIYVCKSGEWELALDFDQRGHVMRGTWTFVTDGSTYAESVWFVTTTGRPIPGRQAIAFSQFTFDMQPLNANLTAIAALSVTDGNVIVGNGTAWVAESGATARASLGVTIGSDVQGYDADTLKADTPDTLTAGFDSTSYNIGTVSTGTLTPVSSNGNFQHVINGGGHALAPPTNPGSIVIEYTNSTAPGSITTTGFGNLVSGSPSTVASIGYQAAILKTSTLASLTWVSS